jgi:hypothetical protein
MSEMIGSNEPSNENSTLFGRKQNNGHVPEHV